MRAAIDAAGLAFRDDRPYRGRVIGRLFRRTVCLRDGLWPTWRKLVMAHELGHHMTGLETAYYTHDPTTSAAPTTDEQSADEFAWTFLLGAPARTMAGLNRQRRAAHAAGLPLNWACMVFSRLALRLAARRRSEVQGRQHGRRHDLGDEHGWVHAEALGLALEPAHHQGRQRERPDGYVGPTLLTVDVHAATPSHAGGQ